MNLSKKLIIRYCVLIILFFPVLVWAALPPPTVDSLIPNDSRALSNEPLNFTSSFSSASGWQNIKDVYFVINTGLSFENCFYGYYHQNTNKFYLRNDDNTAWLGGYAPGEEKIIENTYAKLDCSLSQSTGQDKTLTIKWSIRLKDTMALKELKLYLFVRDDNNYISGWRQMGIFYLYRRPILPPFQSQPNLD